jgi:hypothetical protein
MEEKKLDKLSEVADKINKLEIDPMSEEEFEKYIKDFRQPLHLTTYAYVNHFKSIGRAIRRGQCSPEGIPYPKRPFNNRKGRKVNELKKSIYESLKRRKSEIQ